MITHKLFGQESLWRLSRPIYHIYFMDPGHEPAAGQLTKHYIDELDQLKTTELFMERFISFLQHYYKEHVWSPRSDRWLYDLSDMIQLKNTIGAAPVAITLLTLGCMSKQPELAAGEQPRQVYA